MTIPYLPPPCLFAKRALFFARVCIQHSLTTGTLSTRVVHPSFLSVATAWFSCTEHLSCVSCVSDTELQKCKVARDQSMIPLTLVHSFFIFSFLSMNPRTRRSAAHVKDPVITRGRNSPIRLLTCSSVALLEKSHCQPLLSRAVTIDGIPLPWIPLLHRRSQLLCLPH